MSRIRMGAGPFVELIGRTRFISGFFLPLAVALSIPIALHAQTVYEGNASGNAIEGTAVVESCSGCLNGERVGDIGNGSANYLRIKNISVPSTGTYTVTLYYTEGSDGGARSFTTQINDAAGPTLSNLTGTSWTSPAAPVTFQASFTAGSGNSVGFFNASGPAPDVDHITVSGGGSSGGGGTTLSNVYVTLYGWPDNSPPGDTIAYPASSGYPTIHNVATAGQSYSSPGTFATDALSNGELAVGTIVYDPHFQKYFILEDECVQCETDWQNSQKRHIDLWVGGNPPANDTDVDNCEDSLTLDGQTIIENPPSNESVNTTPLYNSNTNTCW
jgi:hypothetical protein